MKYKQTLKKYQNIFLKKDFLHWSVVVLKITIMPTVHTLCLIINDFINN